MLPRSVATAAVVAATLLAPRLAAADDKPTLSGSWSATALTESWSVSDWGPACGPRPAPQGAGGGSVQIREQGGELSIIGAGRAFSTAQCWEQMPGLSRASHSSSGGGRFWRTRCTSAPNDPRRAAVTTTISATDSSIQLNETGEYQFIIKDTTCRASVTRSRSFSLVRRDGDPAPAASAAPSASAAAPPAKTAAPSPPPPSRCAGSGQPAKLEVHPGRKLLRPGERFAFRATVTDAEGCATGTRPAWAIAAGPLAGKAEVDASGTVTIAADAGEGTLEVSATVGGKGVTVTVEVASPERYDALLGAGGLNDAGEAEQAAVAVIATGTIGGSPSVVEDPAKERKARFVAIVAAVAALLGFAGLVIARRGRRREPPPDVEPTSSGPASEGPVSSGASSEPAPGPIATGPTPADARTAPSAPGQPTRGKVCPTCGAQYGGEAEFCGRDATQLVPLN